MTEMSGQSTSMIVATSIDRKQVPAPVIRKSTTTPSVASGPLNKFFKPVTKPVV